MPDPHCGTACPGNQRVFPGAWVRGVVSSARSAFWRRTSLCADRRTSDFSRDLRLFPLRRSLSGIRAVDLCTTRSHDSAIALACELPYASSGMAVPHEELEEDGVHHDSLEKRSGCYRFQ